MLLLYYDLYPQGGAAAADAAHGSWDEFSGLRTKEADTLSTSTFEWNIHEHSLLTPKQNRKEFQIQVCH